MYGVVINEGRYIPIVNVCEEGTVIFWGILMLNCKLNQMYDSVNVVNVRVTISRLFPRLPRVLHGLGT